jgi:flagellar protein FlgJ
MIPPSSTLTADPHSLDALRQHLRNQPDQGNAEVGRQFEALFIQIMLKNMRGAALAPGVMDSDQSRLYQDLFDTQMSSQLSQGEGLGIGRTIARQLDPLPSAPALQPAPHQHADRIFQNLTLNRPVLDAPPPPPPHVVRMDAPMVQSAVLPENRNLHARSSHPPLTQQVPAIPAPAEGKWPPRSPEAFISELWPHAQRAAEDLGVSPKVLLAQAALESGWGKRQIRHADGRPSFNLFGIKAGKSWDGDRVQVSTLEYTGTVSERRRENFRAYDSLSQAFDDYVGLLKNNSRYRQALEAGKDQGAFADALQRAGYATDPRYAAKIKSILATRMAHLDNPITGVNQA